MTRLLTAVTEAVRAVTDPEMAGVAIGDLGLVRSVVMTDDGETTITVVPTFLGCPALRVIASDVTAAAALAGARSVSVVFDSSIPWTTAQITPAGRAQLAELGIAVALDGTARCPHCTSPDLRSALRVGPASCRSAAWCGSCRSVVEVMRDHLAEVHAVEGSYAHV